jgi:hypothetical protein
MLHTHSHFHTPPSMPTDMTYVLCYLGEPVYSSKQWIDVYETALKSGLARNIFGCIFTLNPGATIQHIRTH